MTDNGRRAQLAARINRLPVAVAGDGDGDGGEGWNVDVLTLAELKALAAIRDAMADRTARPPDPPALDLMRAGDRRWVGELARLPDGLAVIRLAGEDFEGGEVEAVERRSHTPGGESEG